MRNREVRSSSMVESFNEHNFEAVTSLCPFRCRGLCTPSFLPGNKWCTVSWIFPPFTSLILLLFNHFPKYIGVNLKQQLSPCVLKMVSFAGIPTVNCWCHWNHPGLVLGHIMLIPTLLSVPLLPLPTPNSLSISVSSRERVASN